MKKFLFVALIGGALVACNDTSNTVDGVDTTTQAYKDSVANANGGNMMSTPSTDTGMSTTPMMDSASKMMDTSSSKMMGDSMK